MWVEAHAKNACNPKNPLPPWVRVGWKHFMTNGMAWCLLSHTSAAQRGVVKLR